MEQNTRRLPQSPIAGVGAVIGNNAGQVLLIRRGEPPRAVLDGAAGPLAISSSAGLRMMPVTVVRRLTISARSAGALVA